MGFKFGDLEDHRRTLMLFCSRFGSATSVVFCCRNVMAEYVYIGAGMNVSLPHAFRKWIVPILPTSIYARSSTPLGVIR
jgi:hypothetical protein